MIHVQPRKGRPPESLQSIVAAKLFRGYNSPATTCAKLDHKVSADQRHNRGRHRASEPIGSHGGRTMGGNLSACCSGLDSALLRTAISNMCSSNHESFIT